MRDSVSSRGYTSVILVLDMRRFVEPQHQQRFERIRGTRAFAMALRQHWLERLRGSDTFLPLDGAPTDKRTSREEIGFISGIFRSNMLEDYTTPTYLLQKERITFAEPVMQNLQFKELFADVWRHWEIYVRPTVTGMLVVRLTRHYDKATPIITVASDVVRLQMVFDIPGAIERLQELEASGDGSPAIRAKQTSIQEFLKWLGSDCEAATGPDYVPVQWKLAMEVCQQLVNDVGLTIPLADAPIPLRVPDRTTSTPLHDSYVLYHIDELSALKLVVNKARHGAAQSPAGEREKAAGSVAVAVGGDDRHQVLVTPEDVRHSAEIQRNLVHLIEGSVLEKVRGQQGKASQRDGQGSRSRRPSERTNQETFWLSLVLAGLSLSITLFALPSFWADLANLNGGQAVHLIQPDTIQWIGMVGDILAPVLILGSLAIALTATYRFVSFRTRQRRLHRRRSRPDLSGDLL